MAADVVDLGALAGRLPRAWQSLLLGRVGPARLKLVRMDQAPYAEEAHADAEALLVLDGELRLRVAGEARIVRAGELCLVPPGVAHAVEPGSAGTLLIIDV
ncbi:MAG TPA: cupin domain-containing protein [Frateuria sp.]|uniref:cupin domain-containing protein n=1 Tax=Frateuria sp. TaxID=2211372 RepID=UPI002D7F9250|nr:cupin domain-containing protein [Frateuria sp.]HET6804079.1 cupin domain-containing protein [Frateuria sp.]